MYTRSIETIYLSLCALVAVSTFFMKSPVVKGDFSLNIEEIKFVFKYDSINV